MSLETKIPEHHFSGLEEIKFDDLNKDSKKGEFIWGYYDILKRKIVLDSSIKNNGEIENSKIHELGHHVWYSLLPIKLKLKWKIKCLQFRLYGAREAFTNQYASMFGFAKEYVPESKDFENLMQDIFNYLEKNKGKQNTNFNKVISYFLM